MTKGFLLVDQKMNALILLMDDPDPDLVEFMRYKAHTHKTLKELDADIRAYLKGTYIEEDK